MRRLVPLLLALIALALGCANAGAATLPADTTAILSGQSSLFAPLPAPVNDSEAGRESVSHDGRFVAFTSQSDGLSSEDDDTVRNVYVRDMVNQTVVLVSRRDGPAGSPSHADCFDPSISDGGTRVAFTCNGPLDPADTNGLSDVYMRDIGTNDTFLVSRQNSERGGAVGDSSSTSPSISGDGREIAFASSAQNLVTPAPGFREIYVRSILLPNEVGTEGIALESVANDLALTPAQGDCNNPSLSDDGRVLAFESFATNLAANDDNGKRDVFVRIQGQTRLASARNGSPVRPGDGESFDPALDGNGDAVAFLSKSTNLDPADTSGGSVNVYLHTFAGAGNTSLVDQRAGTAGNGSADSPAINDDGTVVVYRSLASNLDPAAGGARGGVYASVAGVPTLISRANGATGAFVASVENVSVSGNGRKVLFGSVDSPAGDAVPGIASLSLRDRVASTTSAVVRPGAGTFDNQGGPLDSSGAVSADGRFVAFVSSAPALGVPPNVPRGVIVRDTETGNTVLASREDGASGAPMAGVVPSGELNGRTVAISAEGRRVAFEARVGILTRIWVRDLATGRTFLASRADGPDGEAGNEEAVMPTISADGNRVAFITASSNFGDPNDDDQVDAYVRDLARGQTILVSHGDGPTQPGAVDFATISADGDHVAFTTTESFDPRDTDPGDDVYVRDIAEGTTRLANVTSEGAKPGTAQTPSISADGTRVAFNSATNFGDTPIPAALEIWVHDFATHKTVLASRADGPTGAPAVGGSFDPLISADGHVVAFGSTSPTLISGPHGPDQVYRRDIDSGTTRLVSRGPGAGGLPVQDFATLAGLTADGGCVTFTSGGGLLGEAPGSGDFSQLYMRTFSANCGRPLPPADAQPPAVRDTMAPVLSGVHLTHARFRLGRGSTAISTKKRIPRGTVLRFRSSEAGGLTILIERVLPGRKVRRGRKTTCKPVRHRAKHGRCAVNRRTATLMRTIKAGSGHVALSGRIGRRRLPAGAYRLTLKARDGAGNLSKPVRRSFTILRG